MDELWQKLLGFVESFTDPHLKLLLNTLLADSGLAQAYREAPAAKQLHHAWLGGLLEHVVSLLTLADRVAPHYPILHRDLLLTGVVLHDIGKVRELAWDVGFEYSVEGTLLGHIQMGLELVEKTIDGLPDFPPRLKTLVLHLILSHHGKLEFGSPKLPMIPEALVLNFVDDLDAKMQAVASEFEKSAREGKGADELTGRIWALDQRQMLNTREWLKGTRSRNRESYSKNQSHCSSVSGTTDSRPIFTSGESGKIGSALIWSRVFGCLRRLPALTRTIGTLGSLGVDADDRCRFRRRCARRRCDRKSTLCRASSRGDSSPRLGW